MHYFGRWDDPDGALANYLAKKDDLHAGRTPKPDADALRVKDVANVFLLTKKQSMEAGELSPLTWSQYKRIAPGIVRTGWEARPTNALQSPRSEFRVATFAEGVNTLEDLSQGMTLEGVVTNVTAFGAFVDVGVH